MFGSKVLRAIAFQKSTFLQHRCQRRCQVRQLSETRSGGGFKSAFAGQDGAWGLAAATSIVCIMYNYYRDQERDPLMTRRRPTAWRLPPHGTSSRALCESTFRKEQSASFQVMAALESKDEVQRIRLAQMLHDLYEVAQQQQEQTEGGRSQLQRRGTVSKIWRFMRRPFRTHPQQKVPPLSVHDFGNITPERAQTLINEIVNNGEKFESACLLSLLHIATQVLKQDETLLDLTGVADRVVVVGDLHGSLSSLVFILQTLKGQIGKTAAVVFDGDFVDRGRHSIEVLCVLLLMKLAYPKHVILLRGNHEDLLVASAYGFQDELEKKYGEDHADDLWDAFNIMFCALPIFAVTESAAIVHGGLPSKDFNIDDIKAVSVEQRCEVKTTIEAKTSVGKLLEGLLWSDPSTTNGIRPNTTRTVGVFYGPDVVADFLKRHNLKYLVRGHEVAEQGVNAIDCGNGTSVMTVFSHSEYPNGEGSNLGAFVNLYKDGEHDLVKFSRATKFLRSGNNKLNPNDPYVETLKSLISSNKHNLEATFAAIAPGGFIKASTWAQVMGETLSLPEIPWLALIPSLAPQSNDDMDHVDWQAFLQLYVPAAGDRQCQKTNLNMEILHANHRMLKTVYKFLDVDGNGKVTLEEFKTGINLLNKRLPEDRKLTDPAALFQKIDRDGNGIIDIVEFENMFKVI